MHGLGTAKDPFAAYCWILAASKAGDHRGDEYLPALQASLDQQKPAQAIQQAFSVEQQSAPVNLRTSLLP
jgi:hypothetical protein